MTNGVFVFALVTCIVICTGIVLAVAILRASWAQRERESLTSSDLTALEESAMLLIEQLKTEADAAAAELDEKCAALSGLIAEADRRLEALKVATVPTREMPATASPSDTNSSRGRILQLASSGLGASDIARLTGVDCAEVKLVLSLDKLPNN